MKKEMSPQRCPVCKGSGRLPRPLHDKTRVDRKDVIAKVLYKANYSYGEIAFLLECSRSMAEKYVKR
jgi:hypothetical protein